MSQADNYRTFQCEDTAHISGEIAKVRSETELYILESAQAAANDARKHQQDNNWMRELRAAISAVIVAQAAIEGYFHALLDTYLLACGRTEDFKTVMGLHRLEERIEEGLKLLTGNPVDKGRQPWQDFHLLRVLRNALVHYKPTWESSKDDLVKLLQMFRSTNRFPLREERSLWEEKILTADCAKWALRLPKQ